MRSLVLSALSLLAALAVLVPSSPAGAAPYNEMASARATALADDPLYVGPLHREVLGAEGESALRERLEGTRVPVYVVLVGQKIELDRYADRLANFSGVSGYFFVVGRDGETIHSSQSGVDGTEINGMNTAESVAKTVNTDPDLAGAPLTERLDRVVDLAERSWTADRICDVLPLLLALVGLALFGTTAWLGVRWWSRRPIRVAPLTTGVAQTVDRAQQDEYRDRLTERLTGCGHRVSAHGSGSEKVEEALEAYTAAAKVLDSAADKSDLVGVHVLLDMCEAALDGEYRPGHCFFDPRHSGATAHVRWRSPGSFDSVRVLACRECRKAVRNFRTPTAVLDSTGPRPLPYYSVPAELSVWAATGYGTLSSDLAGRVMRGERRR